MAEIRSIYTDKRKTSNRDRETYVNGAAVRKLQTVEPRHDSRDDRQVQHRVHRASRSRQEHLSAAYTLFLAFASVLTLWVCTGYLQLQADNTSKAKELVVLEEQLADLKVENDDEYNRVITSVDLEAIREIAVNELGMVYANADQVVLYDGSGSDYVKQYQEIPETGQKFKNLLGTGNR